MKRVLVIVPNWIGDCLMAGPLFRALRKSIEASFIGVLGHRRVVDIFKNNPFIDKVISFDAKNAFPKISMVSKISKERFDTALLLKPSFTKSLLCRLCGIKEIVGFSSRKLTFINRLLVPPAARVHKMDYYIGLVEGLGFGVEKRKSEFFVTSQERADAKEFMAGLPKKRFAIALHPKANWNLKMWPPLYFSRLADLLIEQLDARVFITGSPQDLELALNIEKASNLRPSVLAGRTSLRQLAAILEQIDLFISADTGIMHLAAGLSTPLIALFGATDPQLNGPRGEGLIKVIYKNKNCPMPCYKLDCKDNVCMKAIKPEEVFEEAKGILNKTHG
jgi:heptosyltransferase-2